VQQCTGTCTSRNRYCSTVVPCTTGTLVLLARVRIYAYPVHTTGRVTQYDIHDTCTAVPRHQLDPDSLLNRVGTISNDKFDDDSDDMKK
jgi:hypothetical protein